MKNETSSPTKRATSVGKIGIVIGSLMRGGAEMHLAQLLPELKRRGWDVSVFLIGPSGPVAEYLTAESIDILPRQTVQVAEWLPVWFRRALRFLKLGPRLLKFAWDHRKGGVHFFLPEAFIIGGLLTFFWHRRLIMSRRGLTTYRSKYPAFVIAIERFLQGYMCVLSGNSKAVVKEFLEDGVSSDKICLIYNGLSADRIDPPDINRASIRSELGLLNDGLVFVVLANLHPYKGHMDLINALGRLKTEGQLADNWTLLLIGRDVSVHGTEISTLSRSGFQAELELAARRMNIFENLKFLGERDDAIELLRCADIGILSSHEEGFSNALLEMMAAELGIVATDVGGNGEALDRGRAGLIVSAKNPQELGDAIARLIHQPNLRMSMAKIARNRVLENYTIGICADQYEKLYQDVLGLEA